MQTSWEALFGSAGQVYLFASAAQCALAWVFSFQFLTLQRTDRETTFFHAWTRAWFARAVALSAILLCFAVPLLRGRSPEFTRVDRFLLLGYLVYQSAKFLSSLWLLEGALLFRGTTLSGRRRSLFAALCCALALASVLLAGDIEQLMIVQAPVVILASAFSAVLLLGLPRERRSLGTRLAGLAFSLQAGLWLLYLAAFLRPGRGTWPAVRTPWTFLATHNSYFDLTLDVLVASSLVVVLLQDAHRRQLQAEAERGRLQGELVQTERLRSLGTLISGVAHELNNPLTAILGFSESLTLARGEEERARAADIIREQALRCRRIVRGLTTFSGKGTEVFESVDVHALLLRVAQGFEFELARQQLCLSIQAAELAPLRCDRFAIEQLLANLLANAIQASPPGARVSMEARAGEQALEILVEDEGPGIPPELTSRLFDPFFTTKPPGQGMGLGLAVAHGIATAHDGSLRVENRAPHGARLVVRLPCRPSSRQREEQLVPKELVPASRALPARPIELLVIEDETLLCEMVTAVGRHRGWKVSTASTGKVGLERLLSEGRRFDVVLCDLRMAPPSGIEIHDILSREDPELLERFLFVTGDLSSEETEGFSRRHDRPILRKPFQLAELATRVEDLAAARA